MPLEHGITSVSRSRGITARWKQARRTGSPPPSRCSTSCASRQSQLERRSGRSPRPCRCRARARRAAARRSAGGGAGGQRGRPRSGAGAARRGRARPPAPRRGSARGDGRRGAGDGGARPDRARRRVVDAAERARVSERRVPVGVVGANFEARPNVAVDIACQVLKSGNAVLLRTGAAALETVTALVDRVLRPALEEHGLPGGAVGLVRSPDRAGAEALVSLPGLVPLVILRGSGASTAALDAAGGLERRADARARRGRRRPLRPRRRVAGDARRGDAREPRPARRLQPAQPRAGRPRAPSSLVRRRRGLRRARHRGAQPGGGLAGVLPLDRPRGYDGPASRARGHGDDRSRGGLDEAVQIANEETSGLAATIVTRGRGRRTSLPGRLRGDGGALERDAPGSPTASSCSASPRPASTSPRCPGPRGPVTYRDLYLRQYHVVGDGSQRR